MTTYRPSPRPTFDGPALITRAGITRHVWGDTQAGEVADWIYASTDHIHCLVFGVGPTGSFRHSPEFRTIFGADEYLHVLQGEMVLANPESGDVVHVPAGQGASFGPNTWHHAYAHGGEPLRVLELFAPPPSAGTSGTHSRTRPYLNEADWRYHRDELRVTDGGCFNVHPGTDATLRYEAGVITGIEISTEHITAGWIDLSPGAISTTRKHGGDIILFALSGSTFVRARLGEQEVVAELGPEDAMYVPLGASYDLRNVGAGRSRLIFGVAPSFLT